MIQLATQRFIEVSEGYTCLTALSMRVGRDGQHPSSMRSNVDLETKDLQLCTLACRFRGLMGSLFLDEPDILTSQSCSQ